MKVFHGLVDILLGVILGFSAALLITWWIVPFPRIHSTPADLHSSYKDEYRLLVSMAYDSTGDLDRARLRLSGLQELDLSQALLEQAVRFRSGQSSSIIFPQINMMIVQYLAFLAQDIEITPAKSPAIQPSLTYEQPLPTVPNLPFILLSSEIVCDGSSPDSLARIYVTDSSGQPLPAIEIRVAWETGQQKIFTGLKPEMGQGYADFIMVPGMTYSIQLPSASQVITAISSPVCTVDDGSSYQGGLLFVFQQY